MRDFLRVVSVLCLWSLAASDGWLGSAAVAQEVPLNWLGDQAPRVAAGVSWGVPFKRGEVSATQKFALTTADGKTLPLQQWPLAYWPDASMKWIGFASVGDAQAVAPLKLVRAANSEVPAQPVRVEESAERITVDNGVYRVVIPRRGPDLIESITIGERVVSQHGRLVVLQQSRVPRDVEDTVPPVKFLSEVSAVTVEQTGPVRATIRVQGKHKQVDGERAWLPFDVRFYFAAGVNPIRMVHTFLWDGDQSQDFVRGMGIVFDVPLREEKQNRHVRFGGERDGVWAEPIEPLIAWQGTVSGPGGNVYPDQVAGRRIANRAQITGGSRTLLDNLAVWSDYRLMQPNADGFTIEKRTGSHSAWIDAAGGKRAMGTVFAGDVSGGLGVSLKDFWQSYPKSLEVRNMTSDVAEVRMWLWSPEAPVMDVRHYDDHAHGLQNNYEDVEMELATAQGIGRTHDLMLYPSGDVPSQQVLSSLEQEAASPSLLVATPQYLRDARAFGVWGVRDVSTPFKAAVEGQLDESIRFYQTMIEENNWYGFWNYGDVMHGYDPTRHMWRYDVGGFAWDNSEQATDMWLWYMFLRTGRIDIFRMAEAMTRHTGEVDFHHVGPLAGLGSRHNVRHWGDGAKEARISMAPYRRFHYYLTTDERSGDVMRDALQAEWSLAKFDPMRKALPPTAADAQFKARVRGGPDWMALAGNWMTEWERTQNTHYRDKILAGVEAIHAFPFQLSTGQNLLWGFDPDSGKVMLRDPNRGSSGLAGNMGGPEILMELVEHLGDERLTNIWLNYCRESNGKLAAWVYYKTKDVGAGQRAISTLNRNDYFANLRPVSGPEVMSPVSELPAGRMVTNESNNNSLHAIQILEMCADLLPTEVPAAQPRGGGGRGNAGGRRGGGRGAGGRGERGGAAPMNPESGADNAGRGGE